MRFFIGLLLSLLSTSLFAAGNYEYDNVERVIAIGDVHGAFPRLVALLSGQGLIDADQNWQGGDTHLVSLGDLLDRGPESAKAMDLLMRLQAQAPEQGGRVHVVLGNHEVMNLTGNLSDVSQPELAALAPLGGHQAAFAEHGRYGSWLRTLPFIIRINDSIFTHGGLASHLAKASIAEINAQAHQQLNLLLREGQALREQGLLPIEGDLLTLRYNLTPEARAALPEDFRLATSSVLLNELAPQWYRGNVACHPVLETPRLQRTLASLNAKRVIVGHTPTPNREVNALLEGRVYAIDTGMLASVYKGNARGLRLADGQITAFTPTAPVPITFLPTPDPLEALARMQFPEGIEPTSIVKDQDSGISARFVALKTRDVNRALAAYKLDRLLGLHMVLPTAAVNVGKQSGIALGWGRLLSEAERRQRQLTRPNYCEENSDFALLAAFDALIGKLDRTPSNLWYVRNNWQIRTTENYQAFSNSPRLPQYASTPTLPTAMADKLKHLDLASLQTLLGGLLKNKEIKSLLKRRDAILQWPQG